MGFKSYLDQSLRAFLLAERCFHCQSPLKRTEKIVCQICFDYLWPEQTEGGEFILAPKGSIAEALLRSCKSEFLKKKLLEALIMKAYFSDPPQGVLYIEDPLLKNSSCLVRYFRAELYRKKSPLKGKPVLGIFRERGREADLFVLKALLSKASSIECFYLYG